MNTDKPRSRAIPREIRAAKNTPWPNAADPMRLPRLPVCLDIVSTHQIKVRTEPRVYVDDRGRDVYVPRYVVTRPEDLFTFVDIPVYASRPRGPEGYDATPIRGKVLSARWEDGELLVEVLQDEDEPALPPVLRACYTVECEDHGTYRVEASRTARFLFVEDAAEPMP